MKLGRSVWQQLPVPGGLILMAFLALQFSDSARNVIAPYFLLFFAVVLTAGLVFGAMYNRGRTVLALAVLAMVAWAFTSEALPVPAGSLRASLILVLFPANLALFSLLPEQGLRAATILAGATLVSAQVVWLSLLQRINSAPVEKLLAVQLVPASWLPGIALPQVSLAAFLVALVVLALRFLWKRRATDRALFWAVVAAFLAVVGGANGAFALDYFAAAAVILGIGVLEHAHAVAYVDELTGIPGRRALNEFLPQVLGGVTVAMVDVDHFKKFNDTYGHDAGDQVLRLVARRLAAVQGGGRVFRYGGEEFTVVFPGLSKKEAWPFLEALRASIEDPGFRLRGAKRPRKKPRFRIFSRAAKKVNVTVSIGVAERNGERSSPDEILAAADRALYRAKENGRNQVCLAA